MEECHLLSDVSCLDLVLSENTPKQTVESGVQTKSVLKENVLRNSKIKQSPIFENETDHNKTIKEYFRETLIAFQDITIKNIENMYVTSIEKLSSAVNSSREQELRQQIESITKENLKLNKDMSILTSTNEKLKYLIDHNFQPRYDCTNCPGKDSQL
jgi:hypothetical protein